MNLTRTFQLTLKQRLGIGVVPAVLFVAIIRPSNIAALLLVVVSRSAAARVAWQSGVTLTAAGVSVQGIRRKLVPWPTIRDVRTGRHLGSRFVVLADGGPRRTRLRAPVTGFLQHDAAFDDKDAEIVGWWLTCRSAA